MKKFLNVLFAVLCSIQFLSAQDFPYEFSVLNEPYVDLTDTTSLNNGETWDDPTYNIPIGFEFELFGNTTEIFYISEEFAAGMFALSPFNLYNPSDLLGFYSSDLIDRGYNNGVSQSPISYKTEGVPGNRIFKAEWKNAGFFNEIDYGGNYFINLQIWVYEGSNDIEVRFGDYSIEASTLAHDGYSGPTTFFAKDLSVDDDIDGITFTNFWYLIGDPLTPILELDDSGVGDEYNFPLAQLTDNPTSGTVYRFSNPDVSTYELTERGINIYPTLTNDVLNVNIEDASKETTFKIVDINGRIISNATKLDQNQQIDCSHFPQGMYFISFYENNKVVGTKRFAKQ